MNLAGIHSAQFTNINGKLWFYFRIIRLMLMDDLQSVFRYAALNGIFTHRDINRFFTPNSGIYLFFTRNNFRIVHSTIIHSAACNRHFSFFNYKGFQITLINLRCTGSNCCPFGVDDTTPITMNSGRVSNNHIGLFTGYFHITF